MADPGYRWSDGHPQRRAAWVQTIRELGSVQCGCIGQCGEHEGRCRVVIHDGDEWHLMHINGGVRNGDGGSGSVPGCPRCNLVDAANVTNGRTSAAVVHYDW